MIVPPFLEFYSRGHSPTRKRQARTGSRSRHVSSSGAAPPWSQRMIDPQSAPKSNTPSVPHPEDTIIVTGHVPDSPGPRRKLPHRSPSAGETTETSRRRQRPDAAECDGSRYRPGVQRGGGKEAAIAGQPRTRTCAPDRNILLFRVCDGFLKGTSGYDGLLRRRRVGVNVDVFWSVYVNQSSASPVVWW
jgi:hypothetical protein